MTATLEAMKKAAAYAALDWVKSGMVIGVGTGSTVNFFIDGLTEIKGRIEGAVASSEATAARLRQMNIPLVDLNSISQLPLYVDGADEFNDFLSLVKGGGGALTREKILATCAKQFVCITDHTKHVKTLGHFPVAIEVIPMARSYVARQLVKLGGDPVYREGFVTDNGHVILDVYHLHIAQPIALEEKLNQIPGVIANGIFARRAADVVLMGDTDGLVKSFHSQSRFNLSQS